jgi:hypothetical protein
MSVKLTDAVSTRGGAPMPPVASKQGGRGRGMAKHRPGRGPKVTAPKGTDIVPPIVRGGPVRGASGGR